MEFYFNKRIIIKDGKTIKLTHLETEFLNCFKKSNFVEFKKLAKALYGNDTKLFIDPMKEIKYRVCRKCNLLCFPRYKKGYVMITNIKFMED